MTAALSAPYLPTRDAGGQAGHTPPYGALVDPRMTHALDQFGAALRDVAPVMARFAEDLQDAGFNRAEAVRLTGVMLGELIQDARPHPDRGP